MYYRLQQKAHIYDIMGITMIDTRTMTEKEKREYIANTLANIYTPEEIDRILKQRTKRQKREAKERANANQN